MDHGPYLTEFDLELIRILSSDLIFATIPIIAHLFPAMPLRTIQYRLQRLTALNYLTRRLYPAFYPVPKLALYYAGPRAPEALSIPADHPAFDARRKRATYMKDSAVPHFLLGQNVHAKFIFETRQSPSFRLSTWVDSANPIWQTLHDYGLALSPDAYLELKFEDTICPAFLEIDTGSERGPIIKAKFRAYHDYAASGRFQHHFSISHFSVLFLTTTPRRVRSLLPHTSRFTPHLFWFATFDQFLKESIPDPYWMVPPSDTPQSLATSA
jgi:hypothetical protein